jgi:hypothetical protein
VKLVKQLLFVLGSIIVAVFVARLAVALFVQPGFDEATVLTAVVFVGAFLVTFTGLLLAGMAFLVETSLTQSEKRKPDQISWNWY